MWIGLEKCLHLWSIFYEEQKKKSFKVGSFQREKKEHKQKKGNTTPHTKIMILSCINRAETSFRVEIEQFLFVDEISARSKNV